MSMLDSFFSRGFKGSKCKTALKLTIPRIKLLRNKRDVQLKQMRREIVQLLQTGQEATARIRVEHIIREQNNMAAYEIIELFCELVVVRLPMIEAQRECPLDLKEAIASLCFVAPRCSDLPELQQVQQMFAAKYGREFVMAASELRPDCGVNRQIIEKLSVRAPTAEVKLNLMKEIAEEHEVEWDSSNTEAELFKLHEDLLDGPTHFYSGSKMPLPDEKDKSLSSLKHSSESFNSDIASDDSDLPEVPQSAAAQNPNAEVAGGTVPPMPSAPVQSESERNIRASHDSVLHLSPLGSDVPVVNLESPVESPSSCPNRLDDTYQGKQFVPFISSPPPRFPEKVMTNTESVSRTKSEGNIDLQDVLGAAKAAAESADRGAAEYADQAASVAHTKSEGNMDLQDVLAAAKAAAESADRAAAESADRAASVAHTKSEGNMDLQDVLAAAKAAAESADRAAFVAHAAADLARVKISELTAKAGSHSCRNSDKGTILNDDSKESFHSVKDMMNESSLPLDAESQQISDTGRRQDDIFDLNLERVKSKREAEVGLDANHPGFENKNTIEAGHILPPPAHPHENVAPTSETSTKPLYDSTSSLEETTLDHQSTHLPQRLNSMEDEYYYTYPNIFGSQNSFSQQAESKTLDNLTRDTWSTADSDHQH